MALIVDIKKQENGFEGCLIANKAVVKVDSIYGNKNKICFSIIIYKDDLPIDSKGYNFIPDIEGDNFIKQSYQYLKTLEEFKDSVDC